MANRCAAQRGFCDVFIWRPFPLERYMYIDFACDGDDDGKAKLTSIPFVTFSSQLQKPDSIWFRFRYTCKNLRFSEEQQRHRKTERKKHIYFQMSKFNTMCNARIFIYAIESSSSDGGGGDGKKAGKANRALRVRVVATHHMLWQWFTLAKVDLFCHCVREMNCVHILRSLRERRATDYSRNTSFNARLFPVFPSSSAPLLSLRKLPVILAGPGALISGDAYDCEHKYV